VTNFREGGGDWAAAAEDNSTKNAAKKIRKKGEEE